MAASGAPPASRHLGLDLGGTNIKWVVVEHDAAGWRVLDRGPGRRRRTADGPDAVVARLAEVGAEAIRRCARQLVASGSAFPACTTRRPARPGSSSTSRGPGPGARSPARSAARLGLPAVLINDARAFGLAELRLGAGRGAPLDDRAHARDRRRRRDRDRRPRPPGSRRDGRRDRPPDDRPRRAVVRLRQPRLPRGVRPGRPDRRGVRDGHGRGGGRPRPGRRPTGDRTASPRSAATSASASPT